MKLAAIEAALTAEALLCAGGLHEDGATIWLVAPDTRRFWDHLMASPEGRDGAPDRVDRWSTRVLSAIAHDLGTEALFPFGGPPYQPFLRWAVETGRIWSSPIGPLVHAEMGLWISFRGALRLPGHHEVPPQAARPCDTCPAPCTTACPVGAFEGGQYDVPACRAHVSSDAGTACRTGCLARAACPVGPQFRPPHDQARHHMASFLGQRP
ncbi:ferredoxin [Pontivivens ytuae]|uniref:Ferredoxin n=1 Tax=Pontivivens ytuae TaxID=2789856 RepID=A0A7S9LUJ3_9RHOB|nr:ferredoxin [Pontivivens ytuae]QPH55255.1 ferredoxin [Pontivivens ytuae]